MARKHFNVIVIRLCSSACLSPLGGERGGPQKRVSKYIQSIDQSMTNNQKSSIKWSILSQLIKAKIEYSPKSYIFFSFWAHISYPPKTFLLHLSAPSNCQEITSSLSPNHITHHFLVVLHLSCSTVALFSTRQEERCHRHRNTLTIVLCGKASSTCQVNNEVPDMMASVALSSTSSLSVGKQWRN